MSKPKLIFLGTNSVLERHIEACDSQGQEIAGIIDRDWFGNKDTFAGLPVLDSETVFDTDPERYRNHVFFVAVNWYPQGGRDIGKRRMLIDLVRRHNLPCINLIDPQSWVSRFAKLGTNVFVGANTTIEPHAVIEDFVTIWNNAVIGHNNHVGENSLVQRGTIVHGQIGKNVYVGIGSMVISNDHYISIGDGATIGPGLHVARNVEANEKVSINKDYLRILRRGAPST
jgi:acetyltransferase-like isoleucine patch superfamily enzyme